MKKMFFDPSLEIWELDCEDVITTSGGLNEGDAEDDGYGGFIDLDGLGL